MLNELCGASAEARGPGGGGLLAIAGAAGLGKTTLVAEVRRKAAARGCTLLTARGGEQEQGVAFHVVRQLVQPVLATASEEEHRKILGSWYDIVAPAVGLVAGDGSSTPDPQGVRDGLDWVVTRFAVQRGPVVLVLDDAHWADAESMAWLSSFAPRADDLPLLIVVAYRPEELPAHAAELRKLAERNGSRPLELAPLTPSGVGDLLRDRLGESADGPFSRECWALTGGNLFEAVELIAKVCEHGIEPQDANSAELRELASAVKGSGLVQRLERLGTSAVRLAWAVAVLGTEGRLSLAGSVAGLGAEVTADAVEKLRAARIFTANTDASDRLDFLHPLIGTAVYRAIPPALRVAMHGQAAFAVSEAGLGATAAARHLLEMHPDNDPWAVQQLRTAAREYLRAGAPEAAQRCLTRALREPPALDERAEVLFELGCSALLHEPATTVNHLKAALEEPGIAPALREAITVRLAQALAHTDRLAEAARTVADEGARSSSAGTRLRMQAHSLMWNAFCADEEDSPARSRRLARIADHLTGRGKAERYILGMRAWDAMVRGEPAETALHYAEQALSGGLSWTDENWGFEVPILVALTFMYCDQPGRADELFTQGIAECERKGWRGAHLSFGLTLLGYIRFRRGRLAEAEELVQAGLTVADRVGQRVPAQFYAVGILIEILLARGRVEEAQEVSDTYTYGEIVPNAVSFPDSETVYSELLLASGLRGDAERRLRAVGLRLERRRMRNTGWCPWRLLLAEALAHADPAEAKALAQEGVEFARRFGTPSAIGQALHAAAKVTTGAESLALMAEAVQHLERSPAAYELACALVDHGVALSRAGLPQDAAELLVHGMESATQCGADALAVRARDELSACGLRPLRPRSAGTESLTAKERAVAERVVRGLENTRIAAELGTRERTVELLLSGVYRKIGTDRAGLSKLLDQHAAVRPEKQP
ncbi:ATP-binding protein [Streptomyces sannanensis]